MKSPSRDQRRNLFGFNSKIEKFKRYFWVCFDANVRLSLMADNNRSRDIIGSAVRKIEEKINENNNEQKNQQ